MPMNEYYSYLERKMLKLVDRLAPLLQDCDLELIREHIDADEFGISLEDVVYCILENDSKIGADAYKAIKSLASTMKMEDLLGVISSSLVEKTGF